MDREDRHRGVGDVVGERKVLGSPDDCRRRRSFPLGDHLLRRLDGNDLSVPRLVGARPRTDVDDASSIAQRGAQTLLYPRVRAAVPGIPDADPVIGRLPHATTISASFGAGGGRFPPPPNRLLSPG